MLVRGALAVAAVLLLQHSAVAAAAAEDDVVLDRFDEEGAGAAAAAAAGTRRVGHELAAVSLSPSALWPGGHAHYYIETEGAGALEKDDERVLRAVAHWEERTCIRFTRCATKASCPTSHMRFFSGGGCWANIGRRSTSSNPVSIGNGCGFGSTVHEIGHTLGLNHEQSRKDASDHVFIDWDEIQEGTASNFRPSRSTGDVEPYNYGSIMHYGRSAFAKRLRPTIVSSGEVFGQRQGLSDGDVAAIHFMYNKCSNRFRAPLCSVSRRTDVTHVIPHSAGYKVEFSTSFKRNADVTVSYRPSTAPRGTLQHTKAEGGRIRQLGSTVVTFTPRRADIGKTFTLAVRFTGNDGSVTECGAVKVRVANGDAVCDGKGSDDAGVCSNRGRCVGGPVHQCECEGNWGGRDCSEVKGCAPQDFDAGLPAGLEPAYHGGTPPVHDTEHPAVGRGALRVLVSVRLNLDMFSIAPRVTFYMAPVHKNGNRWPSVEFQEGPSYHSTYSCFSVGVKDGRWALNDVPVPGPQPEIVGDGSKFYFVDLRVDWARKTVDLRVDFFFFFSHHVL